VRLPRCSPQKNLPVPFNLCPTLPVGPGREKTLVIGFCDHFHSFCLSRPLLKPHPTMTEFPGLVAPGSFCAFLNFLCVWVFAGPVSFFGRRSLLRVHLYGLSFSSLPCGSDLFWPSLFCASSLPRIFFEVFLSLFFFEYSIRGSPRSDFPLLAPTKCPRSPLAQCPSFFSLGVRLTLPPPSL